MDPCGHANFSSMTHFLPLPTIGSASSQPNGPSKPALQSGTGLFLPPNPPPIPKLYITSTSSLRGGFVCAQSSFRCPNSAHSDLPGSVMNISNRSRPPPSHQPYDFIRQPLPTGSRGPWQPVNLALRCSTSNVRPAQAIHSNRIAIGPGSYAPIQFPSEIPPTFPADPPTRALAPVNRPVAVNRSGTEAVVATPSGTHFRCSRCPFTASNVDRVVRHVIRSHFLQDGTPASSVLSLYEPIADLGSSTDISLSSAIVGIRDGATRVSSSDRSITNHYHNTGQSHPTPMTYSSINTDAPTALHTPSSIRNLESQNPPAKPNDAKSKQPRSLRTSKHAVSHRGTTVTTGTTSSSVNSSQRVISSHPITPTSSGKSETYLSQCLGIRVSSLASCATDSSHSSPPASSSPVRSAAGQEVNSAPTTSRIAQLSGADNVTSLEQSERDSSVPSNDPRDKQSLNQVVEVPSAKSPTSQVRDTGISPDLSKPGLSSCSTFTNLSSPCFVDLESDESSSNVVTICVPPASDVTHSENSILEHTAETQSSHELSVNISSLVFRPLRQRSPDSQEGGVCQSSVTTMDISRDQTPTHSMNEEHTPITSLPHTEVSASASPKKSANPVYISSSPSSSPLSSLGEEEEDDLVFLGFTLAGKASRRKLGLCETGDGSPSPTDCADCSKMKKPLRKHDLERTSNTSKRPRRTSPTSSVRSETTLCVNSDVSLISSNNFAKENGGPCPYIYSAGREHRIAIPDAQIPDATEKTTGPILGAVSQTDTLQSGQSHFKLPREKHSHLRAHPKSLHCPVPSEPLEAFSLGTRLTRPADRITVDLVSGELFVDNQPLRKLVGGMRLTRMTPGRECSLWNNCVRSRRGRPRLSFGQGKGRPRKNNTKVVRAGPHQSDSCSAPVIIATAPTFSSTPNKMGQSHKRGGSRRSDRVSKSDRFHIVSQSNPHFIDRAKPIPVSSLVSLDKVTRCPRFSSSSI